MRAATTFLLLLSLAHYVSGGDVDRDALDPDYKDAPLRKLVRIYDVHKREEIGFEKMIDRLNRADAVFLGEKHTDEITHRVEYAVLKGLADKRSGKVMLGIEMLKRDQQGIVDDYLAGRITEETFRKTALPSNYQTGYRMLVELARDKGFPVIATNMPRSIRYKAFRGKEALEQLSDEEKKHFPPKLYPNSDAYWERYKRTVRGFMGHMRMVMTAEQRLYSIQCLWDNTMAFSSAQARERYPKHLLLHVNGTFHSANHDGLVAQYKHRRPKDKLATISVIPTHDLAAVRFSSDGAEADYLILVQQRARGLEEGTHAVNVPVELKYILDVPDVVPPKDGWPFLILMPPEGVPSADALKTWRVVLGEKVMLAVVKHLYPQQEEALYVSGRWFWPEQATEDLSRNLVGVERLCSYVSRYHEVDANRTAIVAQGAAATMLAGIGLYSDRLSMRAFGFDPQRYKAMGRLSLPPPLADGAKKERGIRTLEMFLREEDRDWWKQEAEAFLASGLEMTVDGEPERKVLYTRVRRVLGLDERKAESKGKRVLLQPVDSRLGREWAERIVVMHVAKGFETRVCTPDDVPDGTKQLLPLCFQGEPLPELPKAIKVGDRSSISDLAKHHVIPMAPGHFGGTTVLVLPKGLPAEAVSAWQALEKDDVLNKRSRFYRLKVAVPDTPRDLAAALQEIVDSGRSNTLIVPAVFCADADQMRALRKETQSFHQRLTIHWKPGLGEDLHLLFSDAQQGPSDLQGRQIR